jgi:hypothetical protein
MAHIVRFTMEKKNTNKLSNGSYEGVTMSSEVAFSPGELNFDVAGLRSVGDVAGKLSKDMDAINTKIEKVEELK